MFDIAKLLFCQLFFIVKAIWFFTPDRLFQFMKNNFDYEFRNPCDPPTLRKLLRAKAKVR
jgi:hypothetical protein